MLILLLISSGLLPLVGHASAQSSDWVGSERLTFSYTDSYSGASVSGSGTGQFSFAVDSSGQLNGQGTFQGSVEIGISDCNGATISFSGQDTYSGSVTGHTAEITDTYSVNLPGSVTLTCDFGAGPTQYSAPVSNPLPTSYQFTLDLAVGSSYAYDFPAPIQGSWSWTLTSGPSLTPTSTSVDCSPNPVDSSSRTTCTATVSGNSPTGSVSFSTDSSTGTFSQAACTLSAGTCSVDYSDSQPGTYTITAAYGGDSNNDGSSGTFSLTVGTSATSVSVTCSPNPVTVDATSTCTATVSGNSPTGDVEFSSGSSTGGFSPGSCTLSSGSCSVGYSDSQPGSVTITATYGGDSRNGGSSGTFVLVVGQSPSPPPTTTSATSVDKAGLNFIRKNEGNVTGDNQKYAKCAYPEALTDNSLNCEYNDVAGNCTIGFGTLLHKGKCDGNETRTDSSGNTINLVKGITDDQAEQLFENEVSSFATTVLNDVNPDISLTQQQLDALVDFAYNVGPVNFATSTLLKQLNAGYSDIDVADNFLDWVYVNCHTASGCQFNNGLLTRRFAEYDLFVGQSPSPPVTPVQISNNVELVTSSSISQYTVNGPQNQVSFDVSGPPGTQGITAIPISNIMPGPYTVTIDSATVTNVGTATDPSGNGTVLLLEYNHSTHSVVIYGNGQTPPPQPGPNTWVDAAIGLMVVFGIPLLIGVMAYSRIRKRRMGRGQAGRLDQGPLLAGGPSSAAPFGYCPNCGQPADVREGYCINCGAALMGPP